MKKIIATVLSAAILCASAISVSASGAIPDHRGTSMAGIPIGTEQLGSSVKKYIPIFKEAGEQYGVDPNILAAVCMQESSGRNLSFREDGTEYPAWGIMQIEYTLEDAFAEFGERTTGERWTLEDRIIPEKAVPFAAYLISEMLYQYDCDYLKTLQGYNFGTTVLNKIIADKGDGWFSARKDAVTYVANWPYQTYGDAEYVEHVLRYFHNDIEYRGAKVRLNDKLIKFDDQSPIIIDGSTLIPIRAVSQTLGAKVEWDGKKYQAVITSGKSTITIPIDSDTAYIDGEPYKLSTEATIMNGRTMVPLRFVAEALGLSVSWDQDTRTVYMK
jgi:hypothetical protein